VYRSKQIFWGAKDFCPNFPKLARKVDVRLFPTNSLPEKSMKTISGVTSKIKAFILFSANRWTPFFEVKRRLAPFLHGFSRILSRHLGIFPRFSGILHEFLTNQNFCWRSCTPTSYRTALARPFRRPWLADVIVQVTPNAK